ncbi:MAG TPA: pantoate--beta-alanine ligase [Gemmatimonadales bacterium]|nr:pantoate--beta-alanine ligase [Gemmatimonadales bacterium]
MRPATMIELATISDLKSWRKAQRAGGRRIGFVPTMGFLHEGHLALVDEARRRADVVIMSIFVNPLQFGAGEDLARYPRDLPRDRALAAGRGVDALFVPSVATMYPPGAEVGITPGPSAERWEGAARPGHFAGVLTVVAKLFNLVEPDLACFGRKDIQQLTIVRQMVRDLNWPVEIVPVPTVRETDGLALSSRNSYLGPDDRSRAAVLSRALQAAHEAWRTGERRAPEIDARMRRILDTQPEVAVEYISIVEPDTLTPVATVDPQTVVALAARVGGTRLIDNIEISRGIGS